MFNGAFFLRGFLPVSDADVASEPEAAKAADPGKSEVVFLGVSRLELKLEINSNACGESPSRFLRCSAAASFGKVLL